jgi:hypothetical protein
MSVDRRGGGAPDVELKGKAEPFEIVALSVGPGREPTAA